MRVRGRDNKSSLFFACFGALVVITAYRFGLGSPTSPGPGFLPFIAGSIIILLSVVIYAQNTKSSSTVKKTVVQIGSLRVLILTASLVLYALLYRKIGFVATTFFLLLLLFQLLERKSWFGAVFLSVVVVFMAYVVFVVWLQVQLPRGFLGF